MAHPPRASRVAPVALLLPALAVAAPEPAKPPEPAGAVVHLVDGRKVSLFSDSAGDVAVARVADEVIGVRELADALAAIHTSHGSETRAPKRDPRVIVDRLVDLRLMALEARAMGIAELPQYRAQVEAHRANLLRDLLKEEYTRSLQPDPEQVQRTYRDAVREWKVRSLFFAAEADARELAERVKAGASFERLAAEAIAQRKAQGSGEPDLLPERKMLPEVLAEVRKLAPGGVSPVLKLRSGFTVMLLEGVGYPDDPAERSRIRWEMLQARHNEELRRQYELLKKKYARVDRKLLRKLDFEAEKPGIDALLGDRRSLARIQGESPVTVADLAQEIQGLYFHGAEQAAKANRPVNSRKEAALDNLLGRRLFLKEARARKIEETPRFRHRVQDYQNSTLVSAAVERAVVPGIEVTEADERAYYQAHQADYTQPEILRLEGMVFASAPEAETALRKLRAGTDFKFLAQSADGRIEPAELKFDGSLLSAAGLTEAVRKSLAGVKSGDYRLHREGGEHHVIHVLEVIPPRVQPFEKAQADVRKKASGEKVAQAVKEWVAKLRRAYPVEVYLVRVGE